MAVLNGRSCHLADSYACVSHRGASVVDYIAVAHENLKNVDDFQVISVTDAVNANASSLTDNTQEANPLPHKTRIHCTREACITLITLLNM